MSKYGHRTGDWHEAIVNKLGGEQAADDFLAGKIAVHPVRPFEFPVWRRVVLGVYQSPHEYHAALYRAKMLFNWNSEMGEIVSQIPISSGMHVVDLVRLSPLQFEFDGRVRLEDFFKKVALSHYWICPAEVALALRLQHDAQPHGERLTVAMNAVPVRHSGNYLLRVESYGKIKGLTKVLAMPGERFSSDSEFVFMTPPDPRR